MSNLVRLEKGLTRLEGMGRLIESFLSSQDVKETSKKTYQRGLKQFSLWVNQEKVINPTRDHILEYRTHLEGRGLSSYSVSSYLVAVRKFFEWSEGSRLYPNIARGIKGPKKPKNFSKDPLTLDQVKGLLNSIPRSSLRGKRDYALLNLLIRTGLRTVEVIRADIKDISQKSGEAVLWIQGKGRDSKDEFVLLTQDTLGPIREYLAERNAQESEPLFTSQSDRNQNDRLCTRSISRICKDHLKGIGLNDGRLTAHSLRHTSATLSLLGGASLQETQALLRHANINTTLIYSHNIDRLKNAPERKIDALLA